MAKIINKAQDGTKVTPEIIRLRKKYTKEAQERRVANSTRVKKETENNSKKADSLTKVYSKNPAPLPKGVVIKKKKMKNGGSLSGLKASNKRVGPVDPKGAFTKVQKKTLAGAKEKAKLTTDKQLGATKMAKRGMKISKKK
jgi:hypothetical protein